MTAGATALSLIPASLGVLGYVAPLAVVTAGYAVFQTANNTAVMADVGPERRGVVSGMLGLSRNLGLVTGASVMGAVFTHASASADIASAARRGRGHRDAVHLPGRLGPDPRRARRRRRGGPSGAPVRRLIMRRAGGGTAGRPGTGGWRGGW